MCKITIYHAELLNTKVMNINDNNYVACFLCTKLH